MNLLDNTLLQGGKYRIIRFISSGGFGCTYEAELVMLHKRVAIKEFFVKDFCNRDENNSHVTIATQSKLKLVERLKNKFIEEASALFSMQHPNIVRVTDVFEENGTAYYVMDYIDGKSLQEIVKERGALDEDLAVCYIKQVAEALRYIHNQNRLHLDIKPGNIMIDKSEQAILIDFGASKQYDEVDGENTSTILGKTPGYAPLEQIGNEVTKFLPATDIYALGATFYKLVTGVTPISATQLASGERLEPISDRVSASTQKVIYTAMQINKNKRPQSVDVFLNLFNTYKAKTVNKKEKKDEEIPILEDFSEETVLEYKEEDQYKSCCQPVEKKKNIKQVVEMPKDERLHKRKVFSNKKIWIGICLLLALLCFINIRQTPEKILAEARECYHKKDYAKAVELYTKLAGQGNVFAQLDLGDMYYNGEGLAQDYEKAVEWYTKAAEHNYGAAQFRLGVMYYKGVGVAQDYMKAFVWYTKAAEQGVIYAQYNLGIMYYNGEGVVQDYVKAFEWYIKAAEQGDVDAQCRLGEMYINGKGVTQDYIKAFEWYAKAAEQGDANAQYNLGVMYYNGDGVSQDYAEAVEWYVKSAEQGYANAQYNLGYMYNYGYGVPQDKTKAVEWYTKAAEQGVEKAKHVLKELK